MNIADVAEEPDPMMVALLEDASNRPYWLIEWPQHPEPLTVLHPNPEWLSRNVHHWTVESVRVEQWTNDTKDAVRFPSKEDAEAIIKWLWGPENSLYIATEHLDISP